MAKRSSKPDEALGPAVNGLDHFELMRRTAEEESAANEEVEELEEEAVEEPEISILLLCGKGGPARAVARLAAACGFVVEVVECEDPIFDENVAESRAIYVTPNFENIVEECGIGRGTYVGVFLDDEAQCESILRQCLASEASYLGLVADMAKKRAVFAALRASGEPEAELRAVCCPMGLNVGAETEDQAAVAIVAELLAARAGTLNRLRHED